MTSLTDPIANHPSVSPEGSGFPVLAPLDPFLYQDMEICPNCGDLQIFVEVFRSDFARFGYYMGCGEERAIPFSREVAA